MNIKAIFAVLILPFAISTVAYAELFRWVDSSGTVHYSDRVPPEHSKQGHEKLSKNAQRLETVRAQKTREELELDRLQEAKLIEAQKLALKERSRDITLLKTFSSPTEIDRVMNSRIDSIQSNINLIQGKIGKVMVKLKQSEKKKAVYIKEEQLAPQQLVKNIREYRTQISSWQNKITEYKQAQDDTYDKFENDRLRLIELKEQSAATEY